MYDELTAVDIRKMQEEVDYRRLELRPKLLEDVKTAREFGDLTNTRSPSGRRTATRAASAIWSG